MWNYDKPNTVRGRFKILASAEFYDDEATDETLRYCIEQDLEDAGLDVRVEHLTRDESVTPICGSLRNVSLHNVLTAFCPSCGNEINDETNHAFCGYCGKAVKWDA